MTRKAVNNCIKHVPKQQRRTELGKGSNFNTGVNMYRDFFLKKIPQKALTFVETPPGYVYLSLFKYCSAYRTAVFNQVFSKEKFRYSKGEMVGGCQKGIPIVLIFLPIIFKISN